MTDWTMATGNGGTMMIRDSGGTVYFYIKAGSTQTWDAEMPWAYVVNGVTSSWRNASYSTGASWLLCGSWTVSTTQTVTFKLGATGTSGLGGPTTFSHAINRTPPATVPAAPDPVTFSSISTSSVYTRFTGNSNGGASIIKWQLARNTSNTTTGATIYTSTGSLAVTGLAAGDVYYFWARGQNSVGYGPWSSVRSMTTLKLPSAPSNVALSAITPMSMVATFTGNSRGVYTTWTRWELARNTANTTTGATIITSGGVSTITGLLPGTKYYFWARGISSTGTGPWSVATTAVTSAGAYVLVGGVWKAAVPYVKVAGVWKVATPYVRVFGVWKNTG